MAGGEKREQVPLCLHLCGAAAVEALVCGGVFLSVLLRPRAQLLPLRGNLTLTYYCMLFLFCVSPPSIVRIYISYLPSCLNFCSLPFELCL